MGTTRPNPAQAQRLVAGVAAPGPQHHQGGPPEVEGMRVGVEQVVEWQGGGDSYHHQPHDDAYPGGRQVDGRSPLQHSCVCRRLRGRGGWHVDRDI